MPPRIILTIRRLVSWAKGLYRAKILNKGPLNHSIKAHMIIERIDLWQDFVADIDHRHKEVAILMGEIMDNNWHITYVKAHYRKDLCCGLNKKTTKLRLLIQIENLK